MRIPRIYFSGQLEKNKMITLDEMGSHHLLRVLRVRKGSHFILFNGDGGEYKARLIGEEQKKALVMLEAYVQPKVESPLYVHLGQALSRGERMDYAIQKAVELGVDEITPLFTARSVVKLDESKIKKRFDHWYKIIISACEQSGRCVAPILNRPAALQSWFSQCSGLGFFCDPGETRHLSHYKEKPDKVSLLIGSEGGFTDEEIESAQAAHFQGLYLGPRILRTETAALATITLLQNYWGDM